MENSHISFLRVIIIIVLLKFESKNMFFGESGLFDESGREIAFGTGTFVKSEVVLSEKIGYKL